MKNELVTGAVGTTLGIVGTATQTNEILETISLIITICGAIVSFVIVPLLNWYQKAKKDGKITAKEIKEGVETLSNGIEKSKGAADNEKKGESPTGGKNGE